MRSAIVVCSFLVASSAFAQPRSACPGGSPAERWAITFQQVEEQVRMRTAGVKRDAEIVKMLVQAANELNDFQKNAAIDKALDRVKKARQRASERPVAPLKTQEALKSIEDDLSAARLRAATVDMEDLKRQIFKRTHFIQQDLFIALDCIRIDRQVLVELQTKILRVTGEVDDSVSEAVSSTLEYFRAGGQ